MTSMTAPGDPNGLTGPDQSSTPPTYTFGFDSMGRTNSMTGPVPGTSTPGQYGGATYGIAGELLTLNGISSTQSFTYNILGQLTQISAPGMVTLQYEYIAGQNNGRISKAKELISGEEVTYTYDSLNRLTLAETPNGTGAWGQAFTYDGFGNLTSKTATKGTGVPTMSATFDASTNRQTGVPYDANGNPAVADTCGVVGTCPVYPYDVENRLLRTGFNAGAYSYSYDPAGKRIWKQKDMCTDVQHQSTSPCELYFYDIQGRRIATYAFGFTQSGSNWGFWYTLRSRNVYFGNRLMRSGNVDVVTDRLGSVRAKSNGERFSYYPYGEERTPSANGRDKFATYFRDEDGADYADQRYYDSGMGRFRTADPEEANLADPASWNRYSYVLADPVNLNDPDGRLPANISYDGGFTCIPTHAPVTGGMVDASNPCPPGYTIGSPGFGASQSRLQQIAATFEPLMGIIDDWDYANDAGTAFNITLSPDLYNGMFSAGTIALSAGGISIGGVFVTIGGGVVAVATSPVTITVTGLTAVATIGYLIYKEHTKGARESTKGKHEEGQARKRQDRGGEKGDERRRPPRKRPDGWKGPWPPKDREDWN